MDYNSWTFTLIVLYSLWMYATGEELQSPHNVTVVLQDGEVTLVWVPPAQAPSEAYYRVQLFKYGGKSNWTVPGCEKLRSARCDLTHLTTSIDSYWARVQTVKEEITSKWSKSKLFCRKNSELLPPAFSLSSSSASVKVRVHRRPALKDTFPYNLLYAYHLREKGQDSVVNKTVVLTREEEKDVEFDHLTWGREYCIHLEVEHVSGTAKSASSSDQCVLLPPPVWYTAAIVLALSVSCVGVLGLFSVLLHCFLWRPKTLPSTLKSPLGAWNPLVLGEVTVEKVTDQGWFLIGPKNSGVQGEKRGAVEEDGGETRRSGADIGVGLDSTPSKRGRGDGGDRRKQGDSGYGSLWDTDRNGRSGRVSEQHALQDGRSRGRDSAQEEDSGLSLGGGLRYDGSGDTRKEDCQLFTVEGVATGGGYRSQRPSFVAAREVERSKSGEGFAGETDSGVAIAVGYRPSQFSCVCQGKGLCLWCQCSTSLPTKEHSVCSDPTTDHGDRLPPTAVDCIPDRDFKKTISHNEGDLVPRDASFVCHIPQAESVPQLPLECGGLLSSVNAPSLSLRDVELTFG